MVLDRNDACGVRCLAFSSTVELGSFASSLKVSHSCVLMRRQG